MKCGFDEPPDLLAKIPDVRRHQTEVNSTRKHPGRLADRIQPYSAMENPNSVGA